MKTLRFILFLGIIFLFGCTLSDTVQENKEPQLTLIEVPDHMLSTELGTFVWQIEPVVETEHTNIHTSFTPNFEHRVDSPKQPGNKAIFTDTLALETDTEKTLYVQAHAHIAGKDYKSEVKTLKILPAPPTMEFSLHIDAKKHVPSDKKTIAHHYCKELPKEGIFQCQLYDSDASNAKLIGVEFVIKKEAYGSLDEEEKLNWHSHEEEIQDKETDVQLPGLEPDVASGVVDILKPTYGKVVIFWDTKDASPKDPQIVHV